jgi:hypothetical protein
MVGRDKEHLYTNYKWITGSDSVLRRDCDQVRAKKGKEFAHYSISLQKCKVYNQAQTAPGQTQERSTVAA